MKTGNEYYFFIITKADLGQRTLVERFIRDWYFDCDKVLHPQFYGDGEPVGNRLSSDNIDEAVSLWVNGGLGLIFTGSNVPLTLVVNWSRETGKMVDSTVDAWLSFEAGDKLADAFFKFIVEHLQPEFACLTTSMDFKKKHYSTVKTKYGEASKFVGKELGSKIPGVYWRTYLSSKVIADYSVRAPDDSEYFSDFHDGLLIQLFPESRMIGLSEADEVERFVMHKLGL